MKVVQPAIAFAVGLIWKPVGIAALCLFYAAIITDVILTFPEVKKLRNEIRLIDDLEKQLTAVSDAIGSDLSDKTAQAVEFTKEHRITAEEMQKKADMFKAKLETASDSVKQRNSERLSELKGNASERKEVLTARFNELNEKLSELKAKHKRLYKAFLLSATQNAKSGKRRDKPKLSGINQHKADCYAVCCVSQVVYPARFSKVSCQKNRCVFASIFLYLLKRRSILNNRFKLF